MSVTSCVEKLGSGRASFNNDGTTTYTRVFVVKTNNSNDGARTVANSSKLPKPGSTYRSGRDSDIAAVLSSLSPQRDRENARVWEVTATYEAKKPEWEQQPGGDSDEPDQWQVTSGIRVDTLRYQKVLEHEVLPNGKKGRLITNSVGQPPTANPVTADASRAGIQLTNRVDVERFRKYFAEYVDCVNSDASMGAKRGTLKLTLMSAMLVPALVQKSKKRITWEWDATVTVEYSRDGWDEHRMDKGTIKVTEAGKSVATLARTADDFESILDANGQPIRNDVKLDGNGNELAIGANPVYLTWGKYPYVPFAPLKFPNLNLFP